MSTSAPIGLEQARNELPRLVTQAMAGTSTVITRHGRPCAVLVPLEQLRSKPRHGGLLALRGTGAGLWGPQATLAVRELREEWD
jgi:prevent-host-death family protein